MSLADAIWVNHASHYGSVLLFSITVPLAFMTRTALPSLSDVSQSVLSVLDALVADEIALGVVNSQSIPPTP